MSAALTRVFLSLGSNIEPERNLPAAVESLARQTRLLAASTVYETEPVGAPGTPWFWNAALLLATPLEALALKFEVLRPLEAALGRVREANRSAPRPIDLDVTLFGAQVIELPGLTVPDPGLLSLAYVAVPAAELDPAFPHPITGEPLGEIAARLAPRAQLIRRSERLILP